jgi:hypothetical protein
MVPVGHFIVPITSRRFRQPGRPGEGVGNTLPNLSDDVGYRFTRLGKNEATTRASVNTIITAQVTQAMVLNSRELR